MDLQSISEPPCDLQKAKKSFNDATSQKEIDETTASKLQIDKMYFAENILHFLYKQVVEFDFSLISVQF